MFISVGSINRVRLADSIYTIMYRNEKDFQIETKFSNMAVTDKMYITLMQ